jgi:dGTPase
MNDLMGDHGGFEHNLQALRIVDVLEERYPDFPGLNLSYEAREGVVKHSSRYRERAPAEFLDEREPVLEAQLVDLADEIAYTNHDLEDGLSSNILTFGALRDVELWKEHFDPALEDHSSEEARLPIRITVRKIINMLATNLIRQTAENLEGNAIESLEDVRRHRGRLVTFTPSVEKKKNDLQDFLFTNLYRNHRVVRMAEKARRVVRDLFRAYTKNPLQLPPHVAKRIPTEGLERVVCDYVAGMTDRFALDEHSKLFDPHQRV